MENNNKFKLHCASKTYRTNKNIINEKRINELFDKGEILPRKEIYSAMHAYNLDNKIGDHFHFGDFCLSKTEDSNRLSISYKNRYQKPYTEVIFINYSTNEKKGIKEYTTITISKYPHNKIYPLLNELFKELNNKGCLTEEWNDDLVKCETMSYLEIFSRVNNNRDAYENVVFNRAPEIAKAMFINNIEDNRDYEKYCHNHRKNLGKNKCPDGILYSSLKFPYLYYENKQVDVEFDIKIYRTYKHEHQNRAYKVEIQLNLKKISRKIKNILNHEYKKKKINPEDVKDDLLKKVLAGAEIILDYLTKDDRCDFTFDDKELMDLDLIIDEEYKKQIYELIRSKRKVLNLKGLSESFNKNYDRVRYMGNNPSISQNNLSEEDSIKFDLFIHAFSHQLKHYDNSDKMFNCTKDLLNHSSTYENLKKEVDRNRKPKPKRH